MKKSEKKSNKSWNMFFRNSSQNRKAVKSERDSRSHTKSKIKYSTLISICSLKKKSGKSRKHVKKWFSETRVRMEKQSELSEIASPALNLISKSTHTIFKFTTIWIKVGKKWGTCLKKNVFFLSAMPAPFWHSLAHH